MAQEGAVAALLCNETEVTRDTHSEFRKRSNQQGIEFLRVTAQTVSKVTAM